MEHLTADEISPRETPQDIIAAGVGTPLAAPEPEMDRVLARAIRRLIAEAHGAHGPHGAHGGHGPAPLPEPTI